MHVGNVSNPAVPAQPKIGALQPATFAASSMIQRTTSSTSAREAGEVRMSQ